MNTQERAIDVTELKPCPFCGSDAAKMFEGDLSIITCSSSDCILSNMAITPIAWNIRHQAERWGLQTELDWIYSQEQNVELSSFWDGGWSLRFGDVVNGFGATERFDSAMEVAEYLQERREKIDRLRAKGEAE